MPIRGFSNSMSIAEWRHIQSLHETDEARNPDTYVRNFLPIFARWRCAWISKGNLAHLRANPLYYYLVARTKYYDSVFVDAIGNKAARIINVGCGSDTRSYRFEQPLKQNGVRVLECDQAETIVGKQRIANRRRVFDYVEYAPIDLNDDSWPDVENWIRKARGVRTAVLMEGVSPYVQKEAFERFLRFLAQELVPGSEVAYDFKFRGVADDFGKGGRTHEPFRLPPDHAMLSQFHERLGYQLVHVEWSADLVIRLLDRVKTSECPPFAQDGLVRLQVRGS